jgi:hypothetical protein
LLLFSYHPEVKTTITTTNTNNNNTIITNYKSPGIDDITAELVQPGGETLVVVIHKLINSIGIKEELPEQCKETIIVPIHQKGDKTD